MSNTSRWVMPGWNAQTLNKPPKSRKHQSRDRSGPGKQTIRFQSNGPNSTIRQLKKVEKKLLAAADDALEWLRTTDDKTLLDELSGCDASISYAIHQEGSQPCGN